VAYVEARGLFKEDSSREMLLATEMVSHLVSSEVMRRLYTISFHGRHVGSGLFLGSTAAHDLDCDHLARV
jgi:hypothetical protein